MGLLKWNRPRWKIYIFSIIAPILGLLLANVAGTSIANQNFRNESKRLKEIVASIEKSSAKMPPGEILTTQVPNSEFWDCWARRSSNHDLTVVFIVSGGSMIKAFGYLYSSNGKVRKEDVGSLQNFRPLEENWFEVST
jgi:mevalonate pyrophosphate decarboxylase